MSHGDIKSPMLDFHTHKFIREIIIILAFIKISKNYLIQIIDKS